MIFVAVLVVAIAIALVVRVDAHHADNQPIGRLCHLGSEPIRCSAVTDADDLDATRGRGRHGHITVDVSRVHPLAGRQPTLEVEIAVAILRLRKLWCTEKRQSK
jgi:hypothetical protein